MRRSLQPTQVAQVVQLIQDGTSMRAVARRFAVSVSVVSRAWSGSIVVKKASGRPRKSSKHQDRLLKLIQRRDRGTTSTELAQEWQQAGVSASARTVRRSLLEDGLVSRRAAKKPLLSRKNIRDRLIFCKRYRDWTAEDWGKVIFSDESPFRLFGASGKKLLYRLPVITMTLIVSKVSFFKVFFLDDPSPN
uniref:Transposase Tc1-like domain-containing protein n=1 Tax=Salmo trutta TaxID=8032 RepID=A0A673Y5E3_SALTR